MRLRKRTLELFRVEKLSRVGGYLGRLIHTLSRLLNLVGVIVLPIMMLLTVGDVFGRYTLNRPIPGTLELVQFMLLIVVFLGLAYTASDKGHVSIDFVTQRLPPRTQDFIASIVYLVSTAIFIIMTWAGIVRVSEIVSSGGESVVLSLSIFPFALFIVFGSVMLTLVLFTDFLLHLYRALKK